MTPSDARAPTIARPVPLRSSGTEDDRPSSAGSTLLPTWPLTAMLALYPLWWAIGVADIIWVALAAVMTLYLAMSKGVRAPKGFGIWLVFLLWMTLSVIQVDTAGRVLVFGYRAMHYYAITVLFLYVYNARSYLTARFITGALTVFWVITVVGGFLGMLLPTTVFRTPLSYVLPGFLLNNELVNFMVIRRFAQYNPDGFVAIEARPSAPFLYTNNWGNAYSMLLPFVIAYMCKTYGQRRFWVIAALLPASFVPAFATLNRGMFLGLALGALYVAVRYLLKGNVTVLLSIAVMSAFVIIGLTQSSAQDQITNRVEETSTTEDRAEIYIQTLTAVRDSPILGYGTPRPSANPNIPPVGTHGQIWTVMHSHGVPATVFFMGFLMYCFVQGLRRTDAMGILTSTVLLIGLAETLYYGFLPSGLYLLLLACALTMRPDSVSQRRRVGDVSPEAVPSRAVARPRRGPW